MARSKRATVEQQGRGTAKETSERREQTERTRDGAHVVNLYPDSPSNFNKDEDGPFDLEIELQLQRLEYECTRRAAPAPAPRVTWTCDGDGCRRGGCQN